MDACSLSKYIFSYNRLVVRNAKAREGFHQPADLVKGFFHHTSFHLGQEIMQHRYSTGQWCISSPFTHAIDSKVNAVHTRFYRLQHVGRAEVVIVVAMKIKMNAWILWNDLPDKISHLIWGKNTQCIRKHDPFHRLCCYKIKVLENIVRRIAHAIAPVFQIHIGVNPFFLGQCNHFGDFCEMLCRRFFQLMGEVIERAFCEQVLYLGSSFDHPVNGNCSIHKGQYLHLAKHAFRLCPAGDFFYRFKLAV